MKTWNDLLDAATDDLEPKVTFKVNDGWENMYGIKKTIFGGHYVVEKPQFSEHYHYMASVYNVEEDILKVVFFKFNTRIAFDININDVTNINITTKEVA